MKGSRFHMNREEFEKLREKLEKALSAKRYNHTLGVAYTAACLAMRYGVDPEKAELAGLLHDCAKEYSVKEMIEVGERNGLSFTKADLDAPQVLHAVIGPFVAGSRYGVTDPEILSAIRWHTTGHADMTLLEKIIFTADYIEPNRDKAEDLPVVRPLSFRDLTACVFRITEDTLSYLKKKQVPVNPGTMECYEWLKENGTHDSK